MDAMNIDFVTWVSFTGILVYCVHFVWSREKLNKEYSKEEQEQIFGELENVIDNYYQKFVKTIELQNPVKKNGKNN